LNHSLSKIRCPNFQLLSGGCAQLELVRKIAESSNSESWNPVLLSYHEFSIIKNPALKTFFQKHASKVEWGCQAFHRTWVVHPLYLENISDFLANIPHHSITSPDGNHIEKSCDRKLDEANAVDNFMLVKKTPDPIGGLRYALNYNLIPMIEKERELNDKSLDIVDSLDHIVVSAKVRQALYFVMASIHSSKTGETLVLNRWNQESRELLSQMHSNALVQKALKASSEERQISKLLQCVCEFDTFVELSSRSVRLDSPWKHPKVEELLSGLELSELRATAYNQTFDGHSMGIESVCVISTELVVSASLDTTLKVWNFSTGECIQTLFGHTGPVLSVVIIGKGNEVLSTSADKTLKAWNISSGLCLSTLDGHTAAVTCAVVLPSNLVISGSVDGTFRIWSNCFRGSCLKVVQTHKAAIWSLSSGHNEVLASGSSDYSIQLTTYDSNSTLSVQKAIEGHADSVLCVVSGSFKSGNFLLSGSGDKTVRFWNANDGTCLKILKGHSKPVLCVAFLSDSIAATGGADNTVRIWSLTSGECLKVLLGHTDLVTCISVVSENLLFSGSYDNTVRLWDVSDVTSLR
jgi:WD40 repeat protein